MFMRRYSIALLCIFILAPGVMAAEGKSRQGRPPAPVEVVLAVERQMAPVVWVAASLVSRRDVRIAAETEGRLKFIADIGTRVQAGDVLAQIDTSPLLLLLQEQQAGVQRAVAQRDFLHQEVKRLGRLAGQNNAAQTQLERIEAEYAVANADLALATAQQRQSQDVIDRATLRAPFAGVVVQRLFQVDEWVTKAQALLQLVDPLSLEIQADAPLASLHYLDVGDRLLVQQGGEKKTARLRSLTNAAASRSQQLALRLNIEAGDWLAGQSLRLAVPVAGQTSVIAVPRDALVMRRSGVAVFRVNGEGKAERVTVVTGIAEGDWIAVKGDVQVGDQVITRGAERLRPDQAVRVITAMAVP